MFEKYNKGVVCPPFSEITGGQNNLHLFYVLLSIRNCWHTKQAYVYSVALHIYLTGGLMPLANLLKAGYSR